MRRLARRSFLAGAGLALAAPRATWAASAPPGHEPRIEAPPLVSYGRGR